jgi:hypothetical protein
MRDFSLPPPSSRGLRSSGLLYSLITQKSAVVILDEIVKLPIQKNSLNPTSNNLQNPDTLALEDSSPKSLSFAFYQKKAS